MKALSQNLSFLNTPIEKGTFIDFVEQKEREAREGIKKF